MKYTRYSSVLSILLLTSGASAFSASASDCELASEAQQAMEALQAADSSLTNYLISAAGFVVFHGIGKGGLIFGGEHGKGIVYENGNPIGKATLTEINVGPQLGGESFSEVIFFQTTEALTKFKQRNFNMSAELTAVAATEGAALNTNYSDGVMVFTLPRNGLMLQATIGGQKFKYKPFN